jgi:hypothetical protein
MGGTGATAGAGRAIGAGGAGGVGAGGWAKATMAAANRQPIGLIIREWIMFS